MIILVSVNVKYFLTNCDFRAVRYNFYNCYSISMIGIQKISRLQTEMLACQNIGTASFIAMAVSDN